MDEEYHLQKFTKEDLDSFDKIQNNVFLISDLTESIEYLFEIVYGFKNYIVDRVFEEIKLNLTPNKITGTIQIDIVKILDKLEENAEYLTIKERIFLSKIRNLVGLQIAKLQLHSSYPKQKVKNRIHYLLEEHKVDFDKIKEDRLIWLGGKGKAELLVKQWKEYNYIEQIETEIVLSIFCDPKGNTFSPKDKTKIRWLKYNTELALFINGMTTITNKLISDESIWVKVCKCFISKNGKELDPNSMAVSYQKTKPRELIKKIINIVSKADQLES